MIKRTIALLFVLLFTLSACEKSVTTSPADNYTGGPAENTPISTPTATPTPEVRVSNGEQLLLTGDYDAAYNEFLLGSTQATDPDLIASSMSGMGRALMLKKNYREAVNQFSSLLINIPTGNTRNTAYFYLGQAYDALDQPRLAADAYGMYLAALPGVLDSEINEMRGNSLMEYGDYAGAISAFETASATATGSRYDQLQLALAQAASSAGDQQKAVDVLYALYDSSQSDYTRSQVNYLLGGIYMALGQPEQAYARYQDSVEKFTEPYDTYSGLSVLVDAGQTVNQLNRGIIDYNAGQFSIAADVLENYILENPYHTAQPHLYKALSLYELDRFEDEIAEWNQVIAEHSSESDYYFRAFDEKSYTQWLSLNQYLDAAATCLTYVASVPTDTVGAPELLDKAARIYVDGGYLSMAAEVYERIFNEYPGSEYSYAGLFKAGILYFRTEEYEKAQITFQRLILLTDNPSEQAAANLWVAKSLEKQQKAAEAGEYFQKAVNADPTGYYGIRASQILNGQSPFPRLQNIDLAVDFENEKTKAERWMRDAFQLDAAIDLNSPGDLVNNPNWQRAEAYVSLGMRDEARNEYETLRGNLLGDSVNTYRLMNRVFELGFYRSATLASRHILDLAGLSQAATLTDPPIYFNHIRFGAFYRDLIVSTSLEHDLDPILIFSIIRQESLFDSSIVSVAAAQGLMQITPDTATGIVANYGWPENFTVEDLNRPMVNIRLGTHYFKRCLDLYDGNYYAALASYNAGDTATTRWVELSGGDVDLLLEIISYSETREYIKSIVENYSIYESIYQR